MKAPLKLKLKIMVRALAAVFSQVRYSLLAAAAAMIMAGFIIWSLNYELVLYILFEAPLSPYGKIDFFLSGYESLFTIFSNVLSVSIMVFSVLFGINLALMIYVIRRRGFNSIPKKSGGGGFLLAMVGGGCVACGTSLLAPLLATLGATSAPLARDLGAIVTWIGSVLVIYSIYKLSLLAQVSSVK